MGNVSLIVLLARPNAAMIASTSTPTTAPAEAAIMPATPEVKFASTVNAPAPLDIQIVGEDASTSIPTALTAASAATNVAPAAPVYLGVASVTKERQPA